MPLTREALEAHLTAELGDSYDCGRVWEAWSYNTMTEDDFVPVGDRVAEIAVGLMDKFEVKVKS